MQRLIWGMKTIAFSQLERGKTSHKYLDSVDMIGEDGGVDYFYAPCRLKVLGKLTSSSSSHTVRFGSCDENGNEMAVLCADGKFRVVTIALAHQDNIDAIKVGTIIQQGQICYQEGGYMGGLFKCGNHVDVSMAEGWQQQGYQYVDGNRVYRFAEKVSLRPTDMFFALEGFNTAREDRLMDVTLKWTDKKEEIMYLKAELQTIGVFEDLNFKYVQNKKELDPYTEKTITHSRYAISSKCLVVVPLHDRCEILELYPLQKDGWQWARVKYSGIVGFAQIDNHNAYILEV